MGKKYIYVHSFVILMGAKSLVRTVLGQLRSREIVPIPPPVECTDRRGRKIRFRSSRETDYDALVEMYEEFDATSRSQGVPPVGTGAIREWLSTNLAGPGAVAVSGGQIVGHVSFVPDGTGRHELAIFVHPEFQRTGVGSVLLAVGMHHASRERVSYVWASVDKTSGHLPRLYSRAGFSVVNPMGITYRMSRYL